MIYSVWNQGSREYDYYRSPDVQNGANAPAPRHIRDTKLGSTVAQASWPLPSSAVKVGSGPLAQGRIASRGGGALGGTMDSNTIGMIGLGLAAFVLWRSGFLKA